MAGDSPVSYLQQACYQGPVAEGQPDLRRRHRESGGRSGLTMSTAGQRPARAPTVEEMPEQRLNPKADDEECVVLYVEDDDATAYMFQKALEYNRNNVRLFRIDDGEKAVAFLFHEGIFHEAPVPDLVILYLNLPKLSGFEVLTRVRNADELKDIPVVMFSSSTRSETAKRH